MEYGTEAIKMILDYDFNYLNLNNIKLDLMSFNERALNCYKKCGFKEYGIHRKCKFINRKYYDIIEMDNLAKQVHEKHVKWRPDLFTSVDNVIHRENLQQMLHNKEIYVAEIHGKIIAYFITKIKERINLNMKYRKYLAIEAICVDKEYRNN